MNQPVVIDCGTGVTKAGFAGADKPRLAFRSCIGRLKHRRVVPGGALDGSEFFVGRKLEEHRGALVLSYPMEHGVVNDWTDIERVWRYVYAKENLNVPSEDHPVCSNSCHSIRPCFNHLSICELF
jgi:centractin